MPRQVMVRAKLEAKIQTNMTKFTSGDPRMSIHVAGLIAAA